MAQQRAKKKPAQATSPSPPSPQGVAPVGSGSATRSVALIVVGIAVGVLGMFGVQALRSKPAPPAGPAVAAKAVPASYYDLLAMSPDELANVDIALMNLLCAKGLPGAEDLDIPAVLKQIDEWAAKVKFETKRHLYRVNDPQFADHYQHSEARLRAEFIVQVLQEDCGVHYNPARIATPDWRDSRDLFLHGLVGSSNGGSCSSMPLIYVATGRRLGYPMKLVLANSHIFCRWDGPNERFNIEGASNGGVSFHPDEYYRTWPKPISDAEVERGEFLKSLTPQEELSSFLIDRGMCLDMNGRYPEARAAFAEAHRLMPQSAYHLRQLAIAMRQVIGAPGAAERRRQQEADAWLKEMMPPDPQPGRPQQPWKPPVPSQPGVPNPQPRRPPGYPGGGG